MHQNIPVANSTTRSLGSQKFAARMNAYHAAKPGKKPKQIPPTYTQSL